MDTVNSQDGERAELDRAIEGLGRDTRPGRLLRYLGDKYFQRNTVRLTEVDVAIEMFQRNASTFDPERDAVVRVEAHRLRKKLGKIYEAGPGPGGWVIALPAGTYALSFARPALRPPSGAVSPADPAVAQTTSEVASPGPSIGPSPNWRGRWLVGASLLVAIPVLSIGIHRLLSNGGTTAASAKQPDQLPDSAAPATGTATGAASSQPTEIHLLAGYGGSAIIDSTSVRWEPDRYFRGGAAWPSGGAFVGGTSRPFLFANWRMGEFGYDIPMPPGVYELRLHFVSPQRAGDERLSGFNVRLNGEPLLTGFDLNIDAMGTEIATTRVFRDVSPDSDGMVRLGFTNAAGSPSLNGIELVPGIPGRLQPIRFTTQPTSFVDKKGQRWGAEDYFLNGYRSTDLHSIAGTDDPELFASERFGHFRYAIPVDTRGRYTVALHFAEIYYGPQMTGGGGVGSRVFHVFCNGRALLENFDIYKEAGSMRALSKTFRGIRPSAQGKINLTFEPVVNNATVSAIEVIDEGR